MTVRYCSLELLAHEVAMRVVGLGEIERHDPAGMPGDRGVVVEVDEVEREAVGRLGRPGDDRQCERVELVDEPALGALGGHPCLDGVGALLVGSPAGEPARTAPDVTGGGGHHPVAAPCRVEATPPRLIVAVDVEDGRIGGGGERTDRAVARDVAEHRVAARAVLCLERHGWCGIARSGSHASSGSVAGVWSRRALVERGGVGGSDDADRDDVRHRIGCSGWQGTTGSAVPHGGGVSGSAWRVSSERIAQVETSGLHGATARSAVLPKRGDSPKGWRLPAIGRGRAGTAGTARLRA